MFESILLRYKRDLALKSCSPKTQDTYYRNIISFLKHCNQPPDDITKDTVKDYLYYLIRDRKLSQSSLRQARSAICYFFSQTLSKPMEVENIPCQKKERKLPIVFTVKEVFRIINAAATVKHRTMIMLTYSSGLRVGELVNLKPGDIVRASMRLKIRQAKGAKDRYAILSSVCLEQLEVYWKAYRPQEWLFNGRKPGTPLSIRAAQYAFYRAKEKAGISKGGGIHLLRHSFATHMLETGSGLFQLQKFLGHKRLTTTLVYAHIQEEKIIARSPLDVYMEEYSHELTDNDND
jgi:site-specific recombinase XerD